MTTATSTTPSTSDIVSLHDQLRLANKELNEAYSSARQHAKKAKETKTYSAADEAASMALINALAIINYMDQLKAAIKEHTIQNVTNSDDDQQVAQELLQYSKQQAKCSKRVSDAADQTCIRKKSRRQTLPKSEPVESYLRPIKRRR